MINYLLSMGKRAGRLLLVVLLGLAGVAQAQQPVKKQPASAGKAPVAKASATAPAVPAATGRAVILRVSNPGERIFTMPQVRLPDAAAAARLNAALVREFGRNMDSTPATAVRAVRQALAEYQTNDHSGFVGAGYEVLYNAHNLLSVELTAEYLGAYPSSGTRHATFDLRTGRQLTLAQLVADTVALRRRWRREINAAVAEHLGSFATAYPEADAELRADIMARMAWDSTRQQVVFAPNEPRLNDFALSPTGLTLYHSYDFPHVIQALEPVTDYAFPYAQLKAWLRPTGPLGFRR